MKMHLFSSLLVIIFCMACDSTQVSGGRFLIRNDILDKEYNTFVVQEIVTSKGRQSYQKQLSPGEEVVLPFKKIRSLRFLRRYADHSKVYVVKCEGNLNREVRMKLIDVHTNRLDGCSLTRKGIMSRGGLIKWE